MFIYFYKVDNLLNGKVYYGVHKTNNLEDGYMGSGVAVKRAIKKHGIENFKKEIVKYFNSEKEAYEYESLIVDEEIVKSNRYYNMTLGGIGGFSHIDTKGKNNPMYKMGEKQKEIQTRPDVVAKKSKAMTLENNKRYNNGYVNPIKGTNNYWNNLEKAEKAKEKMSKTRKSMDLNGEKNSFYGKKHSKYSLNKMSLKHKNRKRVECPYCKKIGDISNMTRWHLNNCKFKEKKCLNQ